MASVNSSIGAVVGMFCLQEARQCSFFAFSPGLNSISHQLKQSLRKVLGEIVPIKQRLFVCANQRAQIAIQ